MHRPRCKHSRMQERGGQVGRDGVHVQRPSLRSVRCGQPGMSEGKSVQQRQSLRREPVVMSIMDQGQEARAIVGETPPAQGLEQSWWTSQGGPLARQDAGTAFQGQPAASAGGFGTHSSQETVGAHPFDFDMLRVGRALASFLPTLSEDIQRRGIPGLSCPPWCRHLHVNRPGLVGAASACTSGSLPPATLAAFLPAGGHNRCRAEKGSDQVSGGLRRWGKGRD